MELAVLCRIAWPRRITVSQRHVSIWTLARRDARWLRLRQATVSPAMADGDGSAEAGGSQAPLNQLSRASCWGFSAYWGWRLYIISHCRAA